MKNVYLNECVPPWMSASINVCLDEYLPQWMCSSVNVYLNECLPQWMSVCLNECVPQWMSASMNVCLNECLVYLSYLSVLFPIPFHLLRIKINTLLIWWEFNIAINWLNTSGCFIWGSLTIVTARITTLNLCHYAEYCYAGCLRTGPTMQLNYHLIKSSWL